MSSSCEWCEGAGCDECQDTAVQAPPPPQQLPPTAGPTVECEWCDSTGCDECQDLRDAAVAAQGAAGQVSVDVLGDSAPASDVKIKTDCEWCEGDGCEECNDQLEQLKAAAQSGGASAVVPAATAKPPPTTTSTSVAIDMGHFAAYEQSSDDEMNEKLEDDVPTKVVNLYYSGQYLDVEPQYVNFLKIQDFVKQGLFPFDSCSSEAINALIQSITRLSVIRFKLKHPTADLKETFEISLSLHKRVSFSDLLISSVSQVLQICSTYDLELQSGNKAFLPKNETDMTFSWTAFFSALLMKHRSTFPVIFFPVMRTKLLALSTDFHTIYGAFMGTKVMTDNDREKAFYPILHECHALLDLCLDDSMISEDTMVDGANTMTDNTAPTINSDPIFDENGIPTTFGFQANISTTILQKPRKGNRNRFVQIAQHPSLHHHHHQQQQQLQQQQQQQQLQPVSTDYLALRDLSHLLTIPLSYAAIVLEILSLQGCVYYDLDKDELVESILPIISTLLYSCPLSTLPMHVTARIYNLFAYYNMNHHLWQQAYLMFSQAFLSFSNSQTKSSKNDATMCLAFSALSALMAASTSTGAVINPLLTVEAQPLLKTNHIGLVGVATLFNGFVNSDLAQSSAGLTQWVDYCTMFHHLAGRRFASHIRNALLQVTLKRYALSYDATTLRQVLSQFSSTPITKSTQLRPILDSYAEYDPNYITDLVLADTHSAQSRVVAQMILANSFLAKIDDVTSSLHFIQKHPIPVLSTQSEKDIEEREANENRAFSTMVLDNAYATFSDLPLPGAPFIPYSLYYTHGGMPTSYEAIIPFAIYWKKWVEADFYNFSNNNHLQYFYRYVHNHFLWGHSTYTSNSTPYNNCTIPTPNSIPRLRKPQQDQTNTPDTSSVTPSDKVEKSDKDSNAGAKNSSTQNDHIQPPGPAQYPYPIYNLLPIQISPHFHASLQTLLQSNLSLVSTLKESIDFANSKSQLSNSSKDTQQSASSSTRSPPVSSHHTHPLFSTLVTLQYNHFFYQKLSDSAHSGQFPSTAMQESRGGGMIGALFPQGSSGRSNVRRTHDSRADSGSLGSRGGMPQSMQGLFQQSLDSSSQILMFQQQQQQQMLLQQQQQQQMLLQQQQQRAKGGHKK